MHKLMNEQNLLTTSHTTPIIQYKKKTSKEVSSLSSKLVWTSNMTINRTFQFQ